MKHDNALLYLALSQELRQMREHLDQMADTLVNDEHVVSAHMGSLQMFDLLAQRAEEGAAVLERMAQGAPPGEAIAGIRLEQVHKRFHSMIEAR